MTARRVVRELRELGVGIRYEGGQIRVRPRALITDELAEGIRDHREALIWLLRRRLPQGELHEIWVTPEVWTEWMWRTGGFVETPRLDRAA